MHATIRLYIVERRLLWKKRPVEIAVIFAGTIFAGHGDIFRFAMGTASIPDAKKERLIGQPASIGSRTKTKKRADAILLFASALFYARTLIRNNRLACAPPHPIDKTEEFVSSARAADNHLARKHMLAPAEGNTRLRKRRSLSVSHAPLAIVLLENTCSHRLCPPHTLSLYTILFS